MLQPEKVCVHVSLHACLGLGLIFFIAHSLAIPEAKHCSLKDFIPAASHTVCAECVEGRNIVCVFHQRNSQCPLPSQSCVCMCDRRVTSVAVCVAMVMLAAGQDRTCQGGREDRQTGAQTHTYITHTHLCDSRHVSHCVCGGDYTARLNQQYDFCLQLRLKSLIGLSMSMLTHQLNEVLTCS